MRFLKLVFILILSSFFFLLRSNSAFAADYKTDYTTQYIPRASGKTEVKIHVKITSQRADVFIKQFSLAFPPQSKLENIQASADQPLQPPEIKQSNSATLVEFTFKEPEVVKNAQNNIYISFLQKDIFYDRGGTWEFIVPALRESETSTYNVEFFMPDSTKKISLSKPKPTAVSNEKIVWNNVKSPTIYAVFGDDQTYKLDLTYNLKSTSFSRTRSDIALPPETLYQHVFVESLLPPPTYTYLDDDGNYMASYVLAPRQSLKVQFKGYATLSAKPQDDMRPYIKQTATANKSTLLRPRQYWELTTEALGAKESALKTTEDVYRFVLDTLSYNRGRISEDIERLGAQTAFKRPTDAVCMEYTDLFVATARKTGHAAREINGYGYSLDDRLRPQSLSADILHAWTEYYDKERELWIPIDPTWQDTSGIDYFSSFDLNHIVFAIHGKDSVYPLSAGMYKIADTKDIEVKPIAEKPQDSLKPVFHWNIKKSIFTGKKYTAVLKVINESPVFIKNANLKITSHSIRFNPSQKIIPIIAPGQTIEIPLSYETPKSGADQIVILLNDKPYIHESIRIYSLQQSLYQTFGGILVGFVLLAILTIIIVPKLKHDHQSPS